MTTQHIAMNQLNRWWCSKYTTINQLKVEIHKSDIVSIPVTIASTTFVARKAITVIKEIYIPNIITGRINLWTLLGAESDRISMLLFHIRLWCACAKHTTTIYVYFRFKYVKARVCYNYGPIWYMGHWINICSQVGVKIWTTLHVIIVYKVH